MDENMRNIGSAAWGFRALALEEQLALAAKLGFTTHELGIANADTDIPADASAETVARVKKLYTDHGLALCCASTGNDFTGSDAAAQLEKVKQVISLCKELGVGKLRIFSGFTPIDQMDEEKWQQTIACLRAADGFAAEQGVTLCLETHGAVEGCHIGVRHIRSTTTQIDHLDRLMESTNLKIVYDPANLNAVGEDIAAFLEAYQNRIGYVHLKDFAPVDGSWLRPCALWEGTAPWEPLKRKLLALDVPLLMEYENTEDLEAGLVTSVNSWKGA